MSERVCSMCGHSIDPLSRCSVCKRQFVCGSMGVPCDVAGCADTVMDERYESKAEAREDADLFLQEPPRQVA